MQVKTGNHLSATGAHHSVAASHGIDNLRGDGRTASHVPFRPVLSDFIPLLMCKRGLREAARKNYSRNGPNFSVANRPICSEHFRYRRSDRCRSRLQRTQPYFGILSRSILLNGFCHFLSNTGDSLVVRTTGSPGLRTLTPTVA